MGREYKIVFVGSMGSGKTTAIRNINQSAVPNLHIDRNEIVDVLMYVLLHGVAPINVRARSR